MAYRDGPFENLKAPLWLTAGIALVIAGGLALVFLLGDKRETLSSEGYPPAQGAFDRVAAQPSKLMAAPVRGIGSLTNWVGDYFNAVEENRRLKLKLAELEAVRDNAIALKNINARYEALLNIRVQPPVEMATARAVSESRGAFANARLIDAGASKGIRIGNPVINEHGLVGRVVGTSPGISRVLLLTDVASKTPVLVDRSDARAMLNGDGGANPKLDFLRGPEAVKEGDLVLTSGDGGMFPRGLPVGVAARALDGSWRVKLFSDKGDTDYVRVLLFQDFSQLLKPDALNAPPLASLATAPPPTPQEAAQIDALHPVHKLTAPPGAAPKPAPVVAAPVSAPVVPAAPAAKAPAPAGAKPAATPAKTPAKAVGKPPMPADKAQGGRP